MELRGRQFYNQHLDDIAIFSKDWLEAVISTTMCPVNKLENEDSCFVIENGEFSCVAVADGLGGHKGGGLASRLAISILNETLNIYEASPQSERLPIREVILDAIDRSHVEIQALGIGAGTTLTMAILTRKSVRFFNVGDSCSMLIGGMGTLKFKNIEQSPVGYGLEGGFLTEDQVVGHAASGIVLNALGLSPLRIEVSQEFELARRDSILLSSDGLTDNLAYSRIGEIVGRGTLSEKIRRLKQEATEQMGNEKGKPDDLTMILLKVRDI